MASTNVIDYKGEVTQHYEKCWKQKGIKKKWHFGPMEELKSDFDILIFPPSNFRDMWTYSTVGMSSMQDDQPIELHIFSSKEDDGMIELLTVVAYYHIKTSKLNLNHTVNFGRPWQDDSYCNHGIISLPYLDGEELETMVINGKKVKFFWLLPVSKTEVDYKKEYGVDALEKLFEERGLDYVNPDREIVA